MAEEVMAEVLMVGADTSAVVMAVDISAAVMAADTMPVVMVGADTSPVVMVADTTPVVMVGADTSAVAEDEAVTAATPSARREDGISLRGTAVAAGRLGRRLGRLGWLGGSSVLAVSLRRHLLIRAMAV
jgi:CxxC motif-containing protein (DUF1111 family)